MNILYMETSSLLTWLFGEKSAATIIAQLNSADIVVTSDLLKIEGMRALNRALGENLLNHKEYTKVKTIFSETIKSWFIMSIDEAVVERASKPFPIEPVRSLDAIHLATALEYKKLYPQLDMTSTDTRIRDNAKRLALM